MKKVLCLVLTTLLIFSSCSDKSDIIESSKNGSIDVNSLSLVMSDTSVMRYLQADIGDSVSAIGILDESSNSRALGFKDFENYFLAKFEKNGVSPEEVTFKVVKDFLTSDGKSYNKDDAISFDNLPGTVDKVYVLGRYTLVSYVSLNLENLLNAKQTLITESSSGKKYEGSMSFTIGSISHRLDYSYDDNNSYLEIRYTYSDGRTEKTVSEKVTFRNNKNCSVSSKEDVSVKDYDTYGYKNSEFRKSFIIDNETGLLYPVDDDLNLSVSHGVVFDENLGPVALNINDDTLEVTEIIQNKNVYIYDILCDKYNQYYVLNDTLDEISNEDGINVVYYSSNSEYLPIYGTGEMIHIEYGKSGDRRFLTDSIKSVSVIGDGFSSLNFVFSGEIGKGGTITSESQISSSLVEYNKNNGNGYKRITYGSDMTFSKFDEDFLYGYGIENSERVEFGKIDLKNNNCIFTTYTSNGGENYFAVPDASTLLIISRFASDKNKYSLYSAYPYEKDEYKQHYYDFVLDTGGEIKQNPTFDEFRKKYYNYYFKENSNKYTPAEFREKYQIDLSGNEDWVDGWYHINGVVYDQEGIYSDTLETASFYYTWKPGYSDKTFEDMYYKAVYIEDGVKKTDLTNHVLLENINIQNVDWANIDFLNYQFESNSSKGTQYYKVIKDDETGEYSAKISSVVDAERRKYALQPICR